MKTPYFINVTMRNKSSLEQKVPVTTMHIAKMNYNTAVQMASASCKSMEPATLYFK